MHILPAYFLCSLSSSQRGRRYAKSLVTLAVLIRGCDPDPTHRQPLGTPVNVLGLLHRWFVGRRGTGVQQVLWVPLTVHKVAF